MALERIGLDSIKQGFDMCGMPYYALFEGSGRSENPGNLLFSYKENDTAKGWDLLKQNLQAAHQNAPETPFIIRFYEELGNKARINKDTPYDASFKLRMQAYDNSVSTTAKGGADNLALIREIFTLKLDQIDERNRHEREELQRMHEEEIEDLQEQKTGDDGLGAIGLIGRAGERYPWMQEQIKNLMEQVTPFLKGAMAKFTSMTENPAGASRVAGIDPLPDESATLDERLRWSQKTLIQCYRDKLGNETEGDKQYVADMVKLAQVASTKPKTFANAIESLREL